MSIFRALKLGLVAGTAWILAGCAAADLASLVPLEPKALDTDREYGAAPVRPAKVVATASPAAASVAAASAAVPATVAEANPATVKSVSALPVGEASREERITQALKQLEAGDPLAAERLLRSVADGSGDWRVYSGLGVAASTLGRQAEAQSHLKKALQVSPDNQTVLNNLAVSYMLDRKPSEAEVVLKKASATGKASRETLDNLSLARALKAQLAGQD